MTKRHALFVREYLKDLCAGPAAQRAGYTTKRAREMGYQLLKRPDVRAAVDAALAERAKKLELSGEWVLRKLMQNVLAARKAKDFTAANKALELLGKHLALFPERLNIDFRAVAEMSDAELEAEARTLRLVS